MAYIGVEEIAKVCHEANRALQSVLGEEVSPSWTDAPAYMQESILEGVAKALNGYTPEELHESWRNFKLADGWVYGETKDAEKKTHPCLLPYEDLPETQKLKDFLFQGVVSALV